MDELASERCSNCGHAIGARCAECGREFMCGTLGVSCARQECSEMICPEEYDGYEDVKDWLTPDRMEAPRRE